MAKGAAMGLWKGKKGSSVFYKIWNSNNKEKQGIREYQPEVRNPQTDYQADQRARMLPAQLVKGALREIVSRSFQGVPYGSKSRLEFLKYALKAEVYPYIPKGSTDPVPGEYLISRGTLQDVLLEYRPDDLSFRSNLYLDEEIVIPSTTIGELSRSLILNNQQIEEGDQLTFVGCLREAALYLKAYNYYYFSIIIDSNSDEEIGNTSPARKVGLNTTLNYLSLYGTDDNLAAAAIIHSRLGSDGQYLRSTARLTLAADLLTPYFSESTRATTRASYQTDGSRRYYDWPVEESAEIAGTIDGLYTLSGLTGDRAALNGQKVKVRVNEVTEALRAVYVTTFLSELGALVGENGSVLTYQTGQDVIALQQSDVPALANLPAIEYGTQAGRMAATLEAPAIEKPAPAEKKATKKK